ncbi:hypothetical protein QJS10_CPB19g01974 [Acorus calamus]|uniref:Uncharacterized protein n=1 Tax=Acorus calamus TaxID=4465 RepID=A0AAV9CID8_ACOCL|nr:hypothetical protein QJS10_CPB19g01974 [Acorus calamus]
MEMSSTKPMGRFRQVVQAPKRRYLKLFEARTNPPGVRTNPLGSFPRDTSVRIPRVGIEHAPMESKPMVIANSPSPDKQLKSESAKSIDAEILAEHQ